MSRTTPVSAVPAGLMHRCPPPQTWAGRLRASRLSSPPQPVSPRPVYRSVYRDGRWAARFCTFPVLLVAASSWPPAVVSRLAKRPASAGLALTRRTRPRPSCSEEDGPRHTLATRSTARAMVLQTVAPAADTLYMTWASATGLDRRRTAVPRISLTCAEGPDCQGSARKGCVMAGAGVIAGAGRGSVRAGVNRHGVSGGSDVEGQCQRSCCP
jgi:hypothetical protein